MCALAYASRVIHAESCSQKTLSAVQEFIFIALTHDCFPGCCLRHQELLHFRLQAAFEHERVEAEAVWRLGG